MEVLRGEVKVAEINGKEDSPSLTYVNDQVEPISLSLPNNGETLNGERVLNWLSNYLPENMNDISTLRRKLGVWSAVSLLEKTGEDLVGDISFPNEGGESKTPKNVSARVLSRCLRKISYQGQPVFLSRRYSIPGERLQFALTRFKKRWYEPSLELPSTHIFRSAPVKGKGLIEEEHKALSTAKSLGIRSQESCLDTIGGVKVLILERTDRNLDGKYPVRTPQEDFAQAMGIAPEDKYSVDVVDLLKFAKNELATGQSTTLLQQIIFNALIGNSEAGLKSYSLNPNTGTVEPLKDVLPVNRLAGREFGTLGLTMSGESNHLDLTEKHWSNIANAAGCKTEVATMELSRQRSGILRSKR